MGELAIRRNRGTPVPRYSPADRAEKAAETPKTAGSTGLTVSKTLQQLLSKVGLAESHTRESRRILQTGEAVLAEVQDSLSSLAELALKSAGEGETDREALQKELERLRDEIDRMITGAKGDGDSLFLDGDAGDTVETLLSALTGGDSARESLPFWLTSALTQNGLSPEQILSALGLNGNASGPDLLAAIMNRPLDFDSTAGYLAALFLGSVIAGGSSSGTFSTESALDGLRQLMQKVSEGVSVDQAIYQLTNGTFTSLADFQNQFTTGTALGLEDFLAAILLTGDGDGLLDGSALLTLLGDSEGGAELDLMLELLSALPDSGGGKEMPDAVPTPEDSGTAPAAEAAPSGGGASLLRLPEGFVLGRNLSGVSYDEAAGHLTVGGTGDVVIRGTGPQSILVTGSGTVTLQNAAIPHLMVDAPSARLFSVGENTLETLALRQGAVLTLDGTGLLRLGTLRGGETNTLHLTGGAVAVRGPSGGVPGALEIPVVLDGPVSLAAQAAQVRSSAGKPLSPYDILWKTLLPGWSAITSMTAAGREARMLLSNGTRPELARLWLSKEDPSHGSPIQAVIIRGKDASGRVKTRYAYLHWNRHARIFEEVEMYPNPFTVTGGEEGKDWVYEEGVQTLRILSDQVSAVSGGQGVDAEQRPFSGRMVLEDEIGSLELTLNGVVCRVSSGRAFDLGRRNRVTLLLRSGTGNAFSSGEGCAGITLGEGAVLRIDCPDARSGSRNPAGTLSACGAGGGAGIGRDCGGGRDRTSRISIQGGEVTACGTGGGAGVGAGKRGSMGEILILGGTVHSTGGSGGGAGIGGGLGAPAGDIRIRGGAVTALASGHAAAIGAGVQGNCGDIFITGTARILKAQGGDPGADIGACLFGSCGKVQISGGADIGRARLSERKGVALQMGEESVTLPQFRLSSKALGLDRLSVATREAAKAAQAAIEADRRWVAQIQEAYSALYNRLEQTSLLGVRRYINGMVRDPGDAGALLRDTRDSLSLPWAQALLTHGRSEGVDVRRLFR